MICAMRLPVAPDGTSKRLRLQYGIVSAAFWATLLISASVFGPFPHFSFGSHFEGWYLGNGVSGIGVDEFSTSPLSFVSQSSSEEVVEVSSEDVEDSSLSESFDSESLCSSSEGRLSGGEDAEEEEEEEDDDEEKDEEDEDDDEKAWGEDERRRGEAACGAFPFPDGAFPFSISIGGALKLGGGRIEDEEEEDDGWLSSCFRQRLFRRVPSSSEDTCE